MKFITYAAAVLIDLIVVISYYQTEIRRERKLANNRTSLYNFYFYVAGAARAQLSIRSKTASQVYSTVLWCIQAI